MLKVKDLVKTYNNGEQRLYALNKVSFEIDKGDFVVILGPSGSGKSTLLNAISGLDPVDSGSICYDGEDITRLDSKYLTAFRRKKTAFVFQAYYLLPTLTAEANIRMGADLAKINDIDDIIEAVGLKGKENRLPHELSGGEQQRVSIARAIAKSPDILFCDEPTGALDEETGRQIMHYLTKLHKEKKLTVVMVTHNSNFSALSTKVIKMNSGKITDISVSDNPVTVDAIAW